MPINQRTFRVFVSSTFSDMRQERRILQKSVFPRLQSLCESHGATFQAVDLRWGVSEETQLDQGTMDLCLGEIARCQKLSPRPNFIILLGDRYGWQPVPARIPSDEMLSILKQLPLAENSLIDTWYREDLNVIPPEYLLQPRIGEYSNFDAWMTIEEQLRRVLRKAVVKLDFTPLQRIKYFASATHQEIIRGALSPPEGVTDPQNHVFAYSRSIRDLPETIDSRDFVEMAGDSPDPFAKQQLAELRTELQNCLPENHYHEYTAYWDNGCILDDSNAFAEQIYSDLKRVIERELAAAAPATPMEVLLADQEATRLSLLEHFCGRQGPLNRLTRYLSDSSRKPLAIIGDSGRGKSCLMARGIELARQHRSTVLYRFIGTSAETSTKEKLIVGLIEQLAAQFSIDTKKLDNKFQLKLTTSEGQNDLFNKALSQISGTLSADQNLVIFLDALDQMETGRAEIDIGWLPEKLPRCIKLVVSALPHYSARLSHVSRYELPAMTIKEGGDLLSLWLTKDSRCLTGGQKEKVISAFSGTGSPLSLKLLYESARRWASYTEAAEPSGVITDQLDTFFTGMERRHGRLLVEKASSLILSGCYQGLAENEIIRLLVLDASFWKHLVAASHPDHREEITRIARLPISIWSRLFFDLEPYLTVKDSSGTPIISFFHRIFVEYAAERYADSCRNAHKLLADYFLREPLYLDAEETSPNSRRLTELPYQLTRSGRWEELNDNALGSLDFLLAKIKAGLADTVLDDYDLPDHEQRGRWQVCEDFIRQNIAAFMRKDPLWPSWKTFLQLAWEHAVQSPLSINARKYITARNSGWPWLHKEEDELPLVPQPPQCRMVFTGHSSIVNAVAVNGDGRVIVSGSGGMSGGDYTVRSWDTTSKRALRVMKGHKKRVNAVGLTPDGSVAISGACDKTVRVWDQITGKCVCVLEGHSACVRGVAISPSGEYAVSGGLDSMLFTWRLANKGIPHASESCHSPITALVANQEFTFCITGHQDGAIFVRSLPTLEQITKIPAHSSRITCLNVDLKSSRIISGSLDGSCRVWDIISGKSVFDWQMKESSIISVALSPEGNEALVSLGPRDGGFEAIDNHIRLFDLQQGILKGYFTGANYDVYALAYAVDGGSFVSGDHDNEVRVWRADRYKSGISDNICITRIKSSLHGDKLYFCNTNKEIKRMDVARKAVDNVYRGHSDFVIDIDLSVDGALLLSCGTDRTVRLWHEETANQLSQHDDKQSLDGVTFSPDGRLFISSPSTPNWLNIRSKDISLKLRDASTGRQIKRFPLSGKWLTSRYAEFTPDGRSVVCAYDERNIVVLDLLTGQKIRKYGKFPADIVGLHVSPDGRYCFCGSDAGDVWAIDLRGQNHIFEFPQTSDISYIRAICCSADTNILVTGGYDNTLRIWDLSDKSILLRSRLMLEDAPIDLVTDRPPCSEDVLLGHARTANWVISVVFLGAGYRLAVGRGDGKMHFMNFENGPPIGAPIVTAVRIWNHVVESKGSDTALHGFWDDHITVGCPWCGQRTVADSRVIAAIGSINENLDQADIPCLALDEVAWEHPLLLSNCNECGNPLKYNPFTVDMRHTPILQYGKRSK